MNKSTKYTKEQLYRATRSLKRTYINKSKSNPKSPVPHKVYVYKQIAQKLELASDRTLWKNQDSAYLSKWYESLINEIRVIQERNETLEFRLDENLLNNNKLIKAYEKRIESLTQENIQLRIQLNQYQKFN